MLTPHTVHDLMTTDVVAVHPHTAFKDIASLFAERHTTAVPVVDGDRHVLGVISETDLLGGERTVRSGLRRPPGGSRGHHTHAKAVARRAWELMTSPAVTIDPDAPVSTAARLLRRHDIAQLPVVDRCHGLIGILTRGDLLGAFVRSDHDIATDVRQQVLADVLPTDERAISADVTDGVVVLNGRVDRRSLVPVLMASSWQVDGVVDVIEHLSYGIDDTRSRIPTAVSLDFLHRLVPRPR